MAQGESAASLLRQLRKQKGDTLRNAAAELGVAPSQLSRIERGTRGLGDGLVERLSEYYTVPAEVIDIARGRIPQDVVRILVDHPEEILRLREKYKDVK